jgi:hypothetical protein
MYWNIYIGPLEFLKMFMKQQKKLKTLFQLSFFTLLMTASSVVVMSGQQQQSFSQLSEQDTNSATQSPDFLTYDNATYGITIQYPSNWIVDITDFPGDPLTQIVGFFSPFESRVDTYEERLWIAQEQQSFSEDFDLAQYAEQIVSNYNSTLNDFSLDEIDTETARLGNNDNPAYRLVYTERLQPENIDLKTLEIGTVIEDKVYVVMYHAETAKYDQYLPIIEEMINSVELNDSGVVSDAPAETDLDGDTDGDIAAQEVVEDDDGGGNITITPENQTGGGFSTDQQGENIGTAQLAPNIDFLRYETSFQEETLSIDYPSDWEVVEYQLDPNVNYHDIAAFVSPVLSITDPYQDFVLLSVEEFGNETMSLDQYLQYTVAVYNGSEALPSSQVISYSDDVFLTSKNYPAYQVEYTYRSDQDNRQLRAIEVGTVIENKAYFVSYYASDDRGFSQFLPIAQQMIESFELNEAKRTRGVAGTMPNPGSQYLELSYDEWRSDNINVLLLVNPDTEEQSSRYVDEVENAINSWSQILKQYSGNPNAWNFNVSTSIGYLSSIEIGPGRQADLVIELAGDPEGVIGCEGFIGVAPPHPYELTIPVTVHVLTSCLDTQTGELFEYPEAVVYSTALHEFAHALGLGHAFNINNDLMCSAEADINGNFVPTCEFFETDVEEISEADVAALVYKYGIDGFEPPNTELRGPRPFYEVGVSNEPPAIIGEGQNLTEPSVPQVEEWLLYENATYNVQMQYHSSWTQAHTDAVPDRFIQVSDFFSPTEADGSSASFRISIDDSPQSSNIEDYLEESISIFVASASYQDFNVVESATNATLAGMPAYTIVATYTDPTLGPRMTLETGTIFEDEVYYLSYFADPQDYERYLPIIQEMIDSFEIEGSGTNDDDDDDDDNDDNGDED